jgi:hypothetical protein
VGAVRLRTAEACDHFAPGPDFSCLRLCAPANCRVGWCPLTHFEMAALPDLGDDALPDDDAAWATQKCYGGGLGGGVSGDGGGGSDDEEGGGARAGSAAPAGAAADAEDDGGDEPFSATLVNLADDDEEDEGGGEAVGAGSGGGGTVAPRSASSIAAAAASSGVIEILSSDDDEEEEEEEPECGGSGDGGGSKSSSSSAAAPPKPPPQQRQLTLTSSRLVAGGGAIARDGLSLMMASARWQAAMGGAPPPPPSSRGARGGRGGRGGGKPAATAAAPPAAAAGRGRGGGGSHRGGRGGGGGGGRGSMFTPATGPPPFYKRVPGTPFVVDGFRYASPAVSRWYVLTHFHADHYGGLTRHWDAGAIVCTPVTAALVQARLGVRPSYLRPVPLNTPTVVAGVKLTLLDAHHCPGAAMVLFEVPVDGIGHSVPATAAGVAGATGAGSSSSAAAGAVALPRQALGVRAYLHTGDFRWHPRMASEPALAPYLQQQPPPRALATSSAAASAAAGGGSTAASAPLPPLPPPPPPPRRQLDTLFLDTTYGGGPQHAFPPQDAVVGAAVDVARRYAADPGVLLLFGAYTIGKERLFMAVARALGERVYVDATKARTLGLLGWPVDDLAVLTTDPAAARIHVVPMGYLTLGRLAERLRDLRAAAAGAAAGAARAAVVAAASQPQQPAAKKAAAAHASMLPSRRGGGGAGRGGKAPRGRGAYFAALLQQSAAAAAAAATAGSGAGAGSGVSSDLGVDVDGYGGDDDGRDGGDDGGGFLTPSPSASSALAPNAYDALMRGAADAAASAAAAAAAPTYGPFHSIVAFEPTGWAHGGRGGAPAAPAAAANAAFPVVAGAPADGSYSAAGGGDTLSHVDTVLTQLVAHGGAAESAWERALPAWGGGASAADEEEAALLALLDDDSTTGGAAAATAFAPSIGGSNAALLAGLAASGAVAGERLEDTRETRRPRTVEATVVLEAGSGSNSSCGTDGAAPHHHLQPLWQQKAGADGAPSPSQTQPPLLRPFQPPAAPPPAHRVVTVRMTVRTRNDGARVHVPSASAAGAGAGAAAAAPAVGAKRRQSGSGSGAPLPGGVTLLSLPYSEHSSFDELRQAVATLRPARVVPTVNCTSAADAERLVAALRGTGGSGGTH